MKDPLPIRRKLTLAYLVSILVALLMGGASVARPSGTVMFTF